jgi:predicted alpha/beta-hydrolase family hydrolase
MPVTERLTISAEEGTVSALWSCPADAFASLVFAHGAGAGMNHASMAAIAADLHTLGVATLRYQFPYMERGSKRTDPPPLCHATVRAAVATAHELAPALPLFAGGRSFGGRMTSQAQALEPLAHVRGLVFLSFPLHPAGKPSLERAAHLDAVRVPMLFVQGTEDALAERVLLQRVLDRIGGVATVTWLDHADHSLHVPVKSGRRDADVRAEALRSLATWMQQLA